MAEQIIFRRELLAAVDAFLSESMQTHLDKVSYLH